MRLPSLLLLTVVSTPVLADEDVQAWAFSASAYSFFVPDGQDYVQPTLTADRGLVHFEARHNYENLHTSSVWLGLNYGWGETVRLNLVPMLGVVSGRTDGWAPGYKATLGWGRLTVYSEGEYVFDRHRDEDSFFYSWNELTVNGARGLRFGLVGQRTRLYQSERSVQRGLLFGASHGRLAWAAYVFNPDLDKPSYVLSLSYAF